MQLCNLLRNHSTALDQCERSGLQRAAFARCSYSILLRYSAMTNHETCKCILSLSTNLSLRSGTTVMAKRAPAWDNGCPVCAVQAPATPCRSHRCSLPRLRNACAHTG